MKNSKKHISILITAVLIITLTGTAFLIWGRNRYPAVTTDLMTSGQENIVYAMYQYEYLEPFSYESEYQPQSPTCNEPGYLPESPSHNSEYPKETYSYAPEYQAEAPPEATAPPDPAIPLRIPVLAYHSILPAAYYYPRYVSNPWVLSLDTFYLQMRYLYENGFTTITSDQLIDFLFNDGMLPENPIVLTFDDGYLDNALFAAPIMRQFGFIGMQFLITGLIPEYTRPIAANPIQHMSTAEIMETMDVFEFGSHTHAMHEFVRGTPLLVSESVDAIREDILRSFEYPLTFTTGFAYPFGRHSDNARQALQEAGVRFAFTTQGGYLYRDTNPLLIPRFSVTGNPPGWSMEKFSDIVWGRWR